MSVGPRDPGAGSVQALARRPPPPWLTRPTEPGSGKGLFRLSAYESIISYSSNSLCIFVNIYLHFVLALGFDLQILNLNIILSIVLPLSGGNMIFFIDLKTL